jgi:hypothetical protein
MLFALNRIMLMRLRLLFVSLALLSPCIGAQPSLPNLPANEAFVSWLQSERGLGQSAFTRPQTLATGLNLAIARERELRALIEKDPAEFTSRTMSAANRQGIPPQILAHIEKRVQGRGFFGVYCAGLPKAPDDPSGASPLHGGYGYEVHMNGTNYKAFVYGRWRNQLTVYDAAIDGVALGDAIALGDSPTPAEQAAARQSVTSASPTTTGPNTLLYMITQFADQTSDPIDEGTASAQMTVVSNFWRNCSYNLVYLKGIVHSTQVCDFVHIRLPKGATNYVSNFAGLLSDARAAASAQGFNYASYNLDVVVSSDSGFSYAGYSYIGSQGSHWVTPYTTLRTAGHELGHNLGLYHADYWRTDSTQPLGKDSNPGGYVADSFDGEWVEYGHYFSVMSAQYGGEWDDDTKPIYNVAEKVQLGWLSGSQMQYVSNSGTYRLYRLDARTTVGVPRGLRIEVPATDYTNLGRRYWLAYRYAPWSTAQNWYQNGVEVDACQTSYGSDGSIELDMTPYSDDQSSPFYDANSPPGGWWTIDNSDKVDGALIVGRTFDDVPAGIHITPIATGNNGPGEEFIDVRINLGSFAGDRAPAISSFTASANQVDVGQPVTFNITATDPDGDTLAYSWDFDEVQVWTASGLNSSNAVKTWSSPGQYRVQVTVSDMKGGITTASQIITVSTPANTAGIWGRVVWGGQPVYGARISTTSGGQTWTDSDGAYVLTDLIPGSSYVVGCQAAGHTFTPQFSNPVSLASSNAYGADFYANEPLPGAGGATFSISGQVTDNGTGVSGVEVRGGGMLAVTDSSGNYQLSNCLNGTYTVQPRNGAWTFSPVNRSVSISGANSTGNNFARVEPYSITGAFTNIPAGSQSPAPMVYLSNGRSVQATKGGGGGNRYWIYTFSSVPAGQYSLSAELSGYSIVPRNFSNPLTINTSLSGLSFTGAVASVAGAISGRITQLGLPLAGVTIQANQGSITFGSAVSDSDGYYRIENVSNGAYTILPGRTGYSFTPGSLTASVPASGNNFNAAGPTGPPMISSIAASPSTVSSSSGTTLLSVSATGSGPLTYSWDAIAAQGPVSFSTNDAPGASSTTVTFQAAGAYTFRARVTDTNGLPATSNINVTVSAGPGLMVISPYQDQVAAGGQNIAFRADAWDQLGNPTSVSPAWFALGGGTINSSGVFSAVTAGGPYTISATAGGLSATSFVWITSGSTNQPPNIMSQPASQTVPVGSSASFAVSANGTPPFSYQWLYGGNPITAATSSAYTRTNVQRADGGNYSVQVTGPGGSILSSNALLTVRFAGSTAAITSSANPSLPSNGVVFAVVVSAVPPASGTPGGTAQFKIDSTNAGGPVILSGGIARYTNSTLTHGYHTVAAEYAGDANFTGTSNALSPVQLINTPPVAGPDAIQRYPTNGTKVSIVTLLSNDSDADHDPLSFLSFSPNSTNGGTIISNNSWLAYTPAVGFTNTDTFTYTIGDGFGGPVTGTVAVNVVVDIGASSNLTITVLSNGAYNVRGDGIPGRTYRLQYSDVPDGNWQPLPTSTADAFGMFFYVDTTGSPRRFYRSVYP